MQAVIILLLDTKLKEKIMDLEKDIKIKYAENKDLLWLIEKDKHVSENVLKNKIENKEIFVVEKNNQIIGWLRYNLFWDNIPFMNMVYFLVEYRKIGLGAKLVKYWEDEIKKKVIKMY